MKVQEKKSQKHHIRWMLVCYDALIYLMSAILLLILYGGMDKLTTAGIAEQMIISAICILFVRMIGKIYNQVWRYGGIQCYMRLIFTDGIAFVLYLGLELILPVQKITFARMLSLVSLNLLGALTIRMMYRYAYKCGNKDNAWGRFLAKLLRAFSGIDAGKEKEVQKIKVAIIGAGRVGVGLAEELLNNEQASYIPRCFIDINKEKVGREIQGIPVWSENDVTLEKLEDLEFVLAREDDCGVLMKQLEEGILPLRVTHNDTKLNNILFDKNTGEGLCIIDLDTIMPGLAANDFGDSIRFGASTAEEDEKDLNKVHFDIELYRIYVKGYLEMAKDVLTPAENASLPWGARLMTLECGMRFLADFLQGDVYFKTTYPEHNLVRARTQFRLVKEMEEQFDQMQEIVETF